MALLQKPLQRFSAVRGVRLPAGLKHSLKSVFRLFVVTSFMALLQKPMGVYAACAMLASGAYG